LKKFVYYRVEAAFHVDDEIVLLEILVLNIAEVIVLCFTDNQDLMFYKRILLKK